MISVNIFKHSTSAKVFCRTTAKELVDSAILSTIYIRGHGRMPFKLVLSPFALPNSRTQTKDSNLFTLLSYICFAHSPYSSESFAELTRKTSKQNQSDYRTHAKGLSLPYSSKSSTVLARNNAEPARKLTVLRRNKDRTNAKESRTSAKFSPHLHESKKPNKLDSYLKFIHFLSLYVSKFKSFKYNYYKRNPPYLNENSFFKRTLCKKS